MWLLLSETRLLRLGTLLDRTTSDGPTSVSTSSGFVSRLFAEVFRTLADGGATIAVAATDVAAAVAATAVVAVAVNSVRFLVSETT